MATIERSVRKKNKIEIISHEESEPIDETEPLIDVNEFKSDRTEQRVRIDDNIPSAPPEQEYVDPSLRNPSVKRTFMQKVFGILCGQMSLMSFLLGLFVYIPHLRKIARKWILDPLFLSSWLISVPLCIIFILLIVSPSLRKRFAFSTLIIITICLSLLLSYAISLKTAKAFFYSTVSTDLCCLGVVIGSRMGLDFTKWRYISSIPMAMLASSCLAPTILKTSLNNTIWPSIASTALITYLTCNTRPVIRRNDLKLEPDQSLFAVTQLYLQPEQSLKYHTKRLICGNNETDQRSSYQEI